MRRPVLERNPTLLHSPSWSGWTLTEETELILDVSEYAVHFDGRLWRVHVRATGEWIYAGDGPVEVTESPAPF